MAHGTQPFGDPDGSRSDVKQTGEIQADSANPFGNPDGTRGDIDDLNRIFVAFTNSHASGGLGTRAEDMTARFLIGRKGSGKTIHLRRLRAYAATLPEIYAATEEQLPPDSSLIVRFAFRAKGDERTELWRLAWGRAIFRATLSHLLAEPKLRDAIKEATRQRLYENYGPIVGTAESHSHKLGIFAHMKELLSLDMTYRELDKYLRHPLWDRLQEDLYSALRDCRRLCFYLDAADEYYSAAPRFWLECHVGLFFAVMDLLRDPRFGGLLHVFVALRDVVMLKVLQSEHGLRFLQDRHVRVLDWDYKAIRYFLEQKILQLDRSLLAKPDAEDPIERWLGARKRFISTRNHEESLVQYLLRHTRFLPRDVIVQGNTLCQEIAHENWLSEGSVPGDPIRQAVKIAATRFGNELLDRCAGHILADNIPDEAVRYNFESNYLDKSAGLFEKTRQDLVLLLQTHARAEKMTPKVLDNIQRAARETFGPNVDILTALWLNGVIGYVDTERSSCVVFYSHRHATELHLPNYKKMYAFHCSLIDSIGIRPRGIPVVPCS